MLWLSSMFLLTSCPSRAEPIAKKMIVEPEERWFALLGASHHCPRGVQCSHCCSSVYSYLQAIQAYCASNSAPVHTTNKRKKKEEAVNWMALTSSASY
jgi:hypothetical protein